MTANWKMMRKNKNKNKLVVESDGKEAAYMDLSFDDKTVYLDYAFVDPSFRGSGVGNFLVKESVALLKNEYSKIVPVCGYVKAVTQKNNLLS